MKALTVILALLLASCLPSCTPFIEGSKEKTRVGIEYDNQAVADFLFNLFSRPQDTSPFLGNDKTR